MMTQIPQQSSACSLAVHDGEPLLELDPGADIDEPPDPMAQHDDFKRRGIPHHPSEHHRSLLTKALHDTEPFDPSRLETTCKHASMASNVSVASSTELTCDTGNTSPTRTPTPSPPHPGMTYILGHPDRADGKILEQAPPRRRISFACAEPPKIKSQVADEATPKPQDFQRRPTIKFASQAAPKPIAGSKCEPTSELPQRKTAIKFACQAKPRQQSVVASLPGPSKDQDSRPISMQTASVDQVHDSHTSAAATRYISATNGLDLESSRFHEFASDEPQPDDWIVQDSCSPKRRLTMSDVLQKEMAIRKLAKEALEEEEEEAQDEDETDDNEDDAEDEDDDDPEDGDDEEELEDDGYNTDNEHGFADSDDSDNDDDEVEVDVPVWFPKFNPNARVSPGLEVDRPATSVESNSSVFSASNARVIPTHRMKIPRGKPRLPDSTDFVCGTFDEDRVVEDMYLTVMAARKRSKLHIIPQDIDPSFPTSEPEDEEDDDDVSNAGNDSEEHVLGFGDLEDIHHRQERIERRRRRSDACSPRNRCRSPPPKKHISPPYRLRGRSPRPLFGRTSPRRLQPPPVHLPRSPHCSPIQKINEVGCKPLATRPGLTATKSLPRPAGMFPVHLKSRRKPTSSNGVHTRGAIDIVKGLEEKRQRRREKYLQKYCNRARKGQIPEKKPVRPGRGAERMRELGLYMAGKLGPGYVLSI
ncbi:hypothetical protein MKZ38_000444 [Zalerion maritima]|uniref:Uncharacterized protein n=1 Tax=Zalerion maritima TaxID=339359 RepID=A0AAD5WVQ9_9PEZI|nr:hypothetical protein MKZ38_000444 [Zalerion maritima]